MFEFTLQVDAPVDVVAARLREEVEIDPTARTDKPLRGTVTERGFHLRHSRLDLLALLLTGTFEPDGHGTVIHAWLGPPPLLATVWVAWLGVMACGCVATMTGVLPIPTLVPLWMLAGGAHPLFSWWRDLGSTRTAFEAALA